MSEEATTLEEKTVDETKVDETKLVEETKPTTQSKAKSTGNGMEGQLAYLSLFSLPFGYIVSSLPGQYATHATFAMVALFIISSMSTPVQNGRYTGFLFALLWACAGVFFYNMRGI